MNKLLKNICHCFNLKETHFDGEWASFDAIDYYTLSQACGSGCKLIITNNTQKIITVLSEYWNLMCFGKVSKHGEIVLLGITGFPNNDVCVRYLKDISEGARKKKIENNYVFVEW